MNLLDRFFSKQPTRLAHTASFFIAPVSCIALPDNSPILRTPPRPPELQDATYAERFDFTSLFYDVFQDGERLMLVGPALRNLLPMVNSAGFSLDGVRATPPTDILELGSADVATIPAPAMTARLGMSTGDFSAEVAVRPSHRDVFRDRKVLCTISKDNDLAWIADWADFHVKAHGADAVLLYDNASTRYGPEDLLATLRAVPGIAAAVIVPWPYKFGPGRAPGGGGWDSRLAQPVMLEHARRRFLMDAAAMVNLDVDELVVVDDGASLFDLVQASQSGALIYPGRWVEPIPTGVHWRVRHRHYRHFAPETKLYPTKWTAVPSRIPDDASLGVHSIGGVEPDNLPQILFRHFRAVGLNWKYQRTGKRRLSRSRYTIDESWVRQMEQIGWTKAGKMRPR